MALKPTTKTVVIPNVPVTQLVRAFNVTNVRPLADRSNPYEGKINQLDDRNPELYKSVLGTPVVIDLLFKSVTYTDFNKNRKVTTDEVRLQTVLCTVSRPSIIVKTQIQGRNGTVKEYISKDDYVITINGIISGQNGQYPETEALALQRIADAPVAIPVVSRFLNALEIFNIVVEDYSMPQTAGGISKQEFTLNCISDDPLELQIF
ncbi:MAG: hypothetical protein IM569_13565 [Chitinophagaceae bacterium]|nr:hypothetical protein [Chitinophagaceae bacterium]MCA6513877.1 hypothetical protein [Chitinophagaceae bacterium]